MEIILAVLIVFFIFTIYKHSTRIKDLQWNLDSLKQQIVTLKEQIAALTKHSASGSAEAEEQSEDIETSKDVFPETGPPVPAPEVLEPKRPPAAVLPDDLPAKPYYKPAETKQAAEFKPEEKAGIPDQGINWENFLGAKLFAWIGGLSLFIAFIFLLKYSFDRNLISPSVRVALGFICGSGLIAGGLYLKRKTYETTAQTLCATGVVILYATSFAANSIYDFFGAPLTFGLMALITAGAFLLAAGMNAKVIAILGIVGGFLTPPLLSTWQDQPFALFSYITFLNVGLFLVAFYRKWNFLSILGATGTVLILLWWSLEYFRPEKIFIAMAVYLWLNVLFSVAFWYGKKIKSADLWLAGSAVVIPFATFLFTLCLIAVETIGMRPGVIFTYLLGADLCLLAVSLLEEKLRKFQLVAGGCVFFILSLWITARMTADLLPWALGGALILAILHTAIPVVAVRVTRSPFSSWQVHLFPLLALFVMLIPIVKDEGGWLIWPFVLLFNAGILALALLTTSVLAILAAVIVTGIVMLGWILNGPTGELEIGEIVILVGAFGIFFSIVSTYVLNRLRKKMSDTDRTLPEGISRIFGNSGSDSMFSGIPVFSSILPFMLLILASSRIEISNPAPLFGLGLLLTALALGLVRFLKVQVFLPVAMGCFFLLEVCIHLDHFNLNNADVFLGFYVLATAIFFIFPFYYRQDYLKTVVAWATAALSGPLHFLLIYDVVQEVYPNNVMGLLPAVMAVPFFFGLTRLVALIPSDSERRNPILAWFGGSTLFFITLIFPIQFDHQWLTVSWALEGAALIWLYHKIPHSGLRGTGIVLLLVTFIRLGMNPAILLDYAQSSAPIFNWYLYTYGIAIICLMTGGRLLAPPRNRAFGVNVPPVLYALGTILAFLLMNIEIADLFSPALAIRFQIAGNLAEGMAYSIAWALFALCLIIVGIRKQLRPVRLAAIGLIGITLIKLFFFDLSQLDQLYRIGAFVGVAIVLIAASALYQKWVVHKA